MTDVVHQNEQFQKELVNKNVALLLTIICALIAISFAAIVRWDWNRAIRFSETEISKMTMQQGSSDTEGKIRFKMENVNTSSKKYVEITGWLFKNKENMTVVNNRVALYDINTGAYFQISTRKVDKPELDELYEDEFAYANGGFYARVKQSELTAGHPYEVCLLYRSGTSGMDRSNNILVRTGAMVGSVGQ